MANNTPKLNQTGGGFKIFRETISMALKSAFSVNKEISSKLSVLDKETRKQFFLINIIMTIALNVMFTFLYINDIVKKEVPLVLVIVLILVGIQYLMEVKSEVGISFGYAKKVLRKPKETVTNKLERPEPPSIPSVPKPPTAPVSMTEEVEEDLTDEGVLYDESTFIEEEFELEEVYDDLIEEDDSEIEIPVSNELEPLTMNLPKTPTQPDKLDKNTLKEMNSYGEEVLSEQTIQDVIANTSLDSEVAMTTEIKPKPLVTPKLPSLEDKVKVAEEIGVITPTQATEIVEQVKQETTSLEGNQPVKPLVTKKNKFNNIF